MNYFTTRRRRFFIAALVWLLYCGIVLGKKQGLAPTPIYVILIPGAGYDQHTTHYAALAAAIQQDNPLVKQVLLSTAPTDAPVFEQAKSIVALMRQLREQDPKARIFLLGHSQGGNVAVETVALAASAGLPIAGVMTLNAPVRGVDLFQGFCHDLTDPDRQVLIKKILHALKPLFLDDVAIMRMFSCLERALPVLDGLIRSQCVPDLMPGSASVERIHGILQNSTVPLLLIGSSLKKHTFRAVFEHFVVPIVEKTMENPLIRFVVGSMDGDVIRSMIDTIQRACTTQRHKPVCSALDALINTCITGYPAHAEHDGLITQASQLAQDVVVSRLVKRYAIVGAVHDSFKTPQGSQASVVDHIKTRKAIRSFIRKYAVA